MFGFLFCGVMKGFFPTTTFITVFEIFGGPEKDRLK